MTAPNPHQHTDEWFRNRRGHLTSSRMHTIMHGGPRAWTTLVGQMQQELTRDQFLVESLDHVPAIAHGRANEPVAIANAELLLDTEFELVGFHEHPKYSWMGCSSDALAFDRRRNVEVKCPLNLDEHLYVYQTKRMPDKHRAQVQCQMAVWDAEFTYFVSYHPAATHWRIRTVIVEVPRDETYINLMVHKGEQFMAILRGEAIVAPKHVNPSKIPQLF